MRAIAPHIAGVREITLAEDQLEYMPIVASVFEPDDWPGRVLVTRWKPTENERLLIAAGEDIYVAQYLPGKAPFMPMRVDCGAGIWGMGKAAP